MGQNLIAAAGVRATISQIEKYNTAVNTFRSKYDCLPGDCANAANFGFAARGAASGEGDGNGIIQGIGAFPGCTSSNGEAALFWEDLSTAHLIDGGFSSATATTNASGAIGNYFPTAKLGQGNYIYVWSGGPGGWNADGVGETVPTISAFQLSVLSVQLLIRRRGLSVAQAYTIDGKIDDGLPQSGNVIASYNTWSAPSGCLGWSAGGGAFGAGGVGASLASWWGIGLAVVLWIGSIGALQRMAKADPLLRPVYLRHIRYAEFYPAKSGLHGQTTETPSGWR